METIREQTKNPVAVGIVALILGTIFGLVVLGWWIWPVEWVNASPEHLSYENKVEYLRMSIESYGYNANPVLAKEHYDSLGEDKEKALTEIAQNPEGIPLELVGAYTIAATGTTPVAEVPAEAATLPGAITPPEVATQPGTILPPETTVPLSEEEPEEGGISSYFWLIGCLVVIGLAAAIGIVYYLRLKGRGTEAQAPVQPEVEPEVGQAKWTEYATPGMEPPLGQFASTYRLGDDLFDDSFSIDLPTGEFMGECGVGISDTIGVGDPKKVTAFEVWLFDKNDIQTVTKVLMSNHAFTDNGIRQKLAAKGEALLAEPGSEIMLNTQTLQLVARVVDMAYGEGAVPPQSFFERITLEMEVRQRA